MSLDGYMAVWLERQADGFVQIAAIAQHHNIAYLRDCGWTFPRVTMAQDAQGEVGMRLIPPDICALENDGHPQGE